MILGAAAGGGVPQWNCGCPRCADARSGRIPALTQSSVAASADGRQWAVLNASPDIRQQLGAVPALHPPGLRGSPISSVVLTNGDVDHVAGLLTLREGTPFDLYATARVHAVLADNDIFDVLAPDVVRRRAVTPGEAFEPLPEVRALLFPVPGKPPLYREGRPAETQDAEDTVGVELSADGKRVFYIPGCAAMPASLAGRLGGADLVLFDGTVWRDDEMIAAGTGAKTGARMGHVAMDGPEGSIAALAGLGIGRKVFVHINNTNPVLDPESRERRAAEDAGWTIGRDGMEFSL